MKRQVFGLLALLPSVGFGFTFTDGEFADGTWLGGVQHQSSGGIPDAYGSYSFSSGGGGMLQWYFLRRADFVYDPSVSGALTNLQMSVDQKTSGTFPVNAHLLVVQGNQTYLHVASATPLSPPWVHRYATNMFASDFWDYFHLQHPNFSASGTPITFGVIFTFLTEDPVIVSGGLDNFFATNQPVPEPASMLVLAGGLAIVARRFRKRG